MGEKEVSWQWLTSDTTVRGALVGLADGSVYLSILLD